MGFLQGRIDDNPVIEKDVAIADKFVVRVRWLTPKQRDEIAKQCTEYKRGMPDINRERHARAYTKRAIIGWSGLTVKTMTGPLFVKLTPEGLDYCKRLEAENGGELPWSLDDSATLYMSALPEKYANKIKEAMDDFDDNADAQEEDIRGKSTTSSST